MSMMLNVTISLRLRLIINLSLATILVVSVVCEDNSTSKESTELESASVWIQAFRGIQKASSRGLTIVGDIITGVPLTTIILIAGGLISIILRLIVVFGPIFLLGTVTRDSSEATNFLKLIIEAYNMVIEAIENGQSSQDEETVT